MVFHATNKRPGRRDSTQQQVNKLTFIQPQSASHWQSTCLSMAAVFVLLPQKPRLDYVIPTSGRRMSDQALRTRHSGPRFASLSEPRDRARWRSSEPPTLDEASDYIDMIFAHTRAC